MAAPGGSISGSPRETTEQPSISEADGGNKVVAGAGVARVQHAAGHLGWLATPSKTQ